MASTSNMKRFNDRVILVTGGARGIGQAVALRLAAEGANVYILDMLDGQQTLDKIKSNSVESYSKCGFMKMDVTDFAHVRRCVDTIGNKHGRIDGVVQCAGVTGKTGLAAHTVDGADFERVWRINVLGIFNVSKAVLPYMLKANYGRIVNIASISGKEGNPGQLAYASSKGAVIAMTKTMGKDYAKTGITINSLAPAVIQTEMVDAMPRSQVDMMTSKIPMERCGELKEIGAVIAFMASQENSFST